MDISVIIVNWRSAAYLQKCLRSLHPALDGLDAEVIVIDNASFDGSASVTAADFPGAIFIQEENNLGFAGANNAAARRARGDMLLFLNPDTEVEPDAVRRLLESLRGWASAAIAGPRVLNGDRTVQTSCVQSFPTVVNQLLDSEFLRRVWPSAPFWGTKALVHESAEASVVEAVAGSCLMIRRSVFEDLNGFDTRYFMYGEDLDLCRRVARLGSSCLHVPRARIIHYGGGSSSLVGSGFSIVTMRQAVYRFMRIHQGAWRAVLYRLSLGFSALLRIPLAIVTLPFRRGRSLQTMRKWSWIALWSVGWTPGYARRG